MKLLFSQGIPYAVPPLNELRWSRPIPLWKDEQKCLSNHNYYHFAHQFGSICAQINPFNDTFIGSEDCLYLNVWTPRIDEEVSCCYYYLWQLVTVKSSYNHIHIVTNIPVFCSIELPLYFIVIISMTFGTMNIFQDRKFILEI